MEWIPNSEGWKTINTSANDLIIYEPKSSWKQAEATYGYNKDVQVLYSNYKGKIRFNITGNKLRIISVSSETGDNIKVFINGELDYIIPCTVEQRTRYKYICYEKQFKDSKEKYIEIDGTDNKCNFYFDAIDISTEGELKLYNENPINNKYLLKQNSQYYTLKSEFHLNGNFTPITLTGGTLPNENDYENFGFDDLNDLCANMTFGDETFRPIDKIRKQFGNKFQILTMEEIV